MKKDGTPETDLEEWLLEFGLGFSYAATCDRDLTKAQTETLAESTPDPDRNPKHSWLLAELQSHTNES